MSLPARLDRRRLLEGLDEELFGTVTVLDEVGSTNVALVAAARAGASRGVLTTEYQSAGRGRLDRVWTAPPRSGLAVSVLLSPPVPARRWSWLPLVTGLALLDALTAGAELPAGVRIALKWPNDVLVDGSKLAGILAERVDDRRVVVGLGLNVSIRAEELPVAAATSLAQVGASVLDRTTLLTGYLAALSTHCRRWWAEPDDSAVRARYLLACDTIGRPVEVHRPDGRAHRGTAVDVDAAGALVVTTDTPVPLVVAAGDVTHVRPG